MSSHPEFIWKGEINAENGIATWKVGKNSRSIEMATFTEANWVAALLTEAYLAGRAEAKRDALAAVKSAIDGML